MGNQEEPAPNAALVVVEPPVFDEELLSCAVECDNNISSEPLVDNEWDEPHMSAGEVEEMNGLDRDNVYKAYQRAVLAGVADFYQIGEGVCVVRGWNAKKEEPTVRGMLAK